MVSQQPSEKREGNLRSVTIRRCFFWVQFFQLARSKPKLVIQFLFQQTSWSLEKGEAERGWLYASGHGER